MVVVRTVGDHDIGIPLPDQTRDGSPVFQCGHDLAVVDIEHFVGDAEPPRNLLHFFQSALRQRPARGLPVSDIAIGGGDQLDVMSGLGPFHRDAGAAIFGVIGMRAENNDPQFAVAALRRGGRDRKNTG
jgi:hypothetical protein